ncbi:unnamed protein product [Prunus brigantina]
MEPFETWTQNFSKMKGYPKYVCVDGDGTVPAESAERPMVSSISVSDVGAEACATITVHPQNEGKQHVELNALSVSVDA